MRKEQFKLLFEKNYDKKRKWKPIYTTDDLNGIVVVCNSKQVSSTEIKQILTDLKHILSARFVLGKYKTIYFNFDSFNPNDKLVYILIESVIYSLITEYDYNAELRLNLFEGNINTQGFVHTALGKMAQGLLSKKQFIEEYRFSIDKYHYRRIVYADSDMLSTSNMLSEIKTFLFRFSLPEDFKSKFAKTVTELVDNAYEHGKADCIVDIDVTEPDYKNKNSENEEINFWGINVVVLNFSETCLGDEVRDKIKNHYYKDSERYNCVEIAYNFHRKKFSNKTYTEDDFFNITAFQEKISGRANETNSGGTGLAELIKNLQEYAYEDYCYAMTGNKGIFFRKEFLYFDKNKWIGFNNENDYFSNIPSKEVILRSSAYLPGTGYNFMFVFKENK